MGLVSDIGQALGIMADPSAGAGYGQASIEQVEQAVRELESVGIPSVDAQRIVLQRPDLVGLLEAEELGPTELRKLAEDVELGNVQRQALEQLVERGEVGLTEEDRMAFEELQRQAANQQAAQQATILQQAAQRGALDSGSQLLAQLTGSQAATTQAQQAGNQMAQAALQQRREALQQAANLASGMSQQQYQRQAREAQAQDVINQFNLANRQDIAARNLAARQQQAQQRADISNRQQMYNKQLLRQDYLDRLAKAQSIAGARTGLSQAYGQRAAAEANAAQQEAAGTRAILGGAAGAFMGGGAGAAGLSNLIGSLGGSPGTDLGSGAVSPYQDDNEGSFSFS